MGRKENFIKKFGITPAEFKRRKKYSREVWNEIVNKEKLEYSKRTKELNDEENDYGGGDENEIDEDSHCDMVKENY